MAEAFAQALGRGAAVETPDRWIWCAAFRIAAGELKERRRVAASDVLRASVDMPEPVADLVRALRTLSPHQRTAAVLSLYADMSTRDVARTRWRTPMSDLRERFRALDTLDVPDVMSRARLMGPKPPEPDPTPPFRRAGALVFAAIVAPWPCS
jgi:DNA-directed RNA polymerase specialized sigma24 family protein